MGTALKNDLGETNTLSIKRSIIALCVFSAATCSCLGACKIIARPSGSTWASVDGFVVSSDIEAHTVDQTGSSRSTDLYYDAVVGFQYAIDGQTYVNRHILGNVTKNDPARAQEVMETYSEGKVVRILYDPQSPSSSRIDTTSAGDPVRLFLIGIVFILAAVLAHRMIKVKAPRKKAGPSKPLTATPDSTPRSVHRDAPSPKPQKDIAGTWILDFQVPSMREIIASNQQAKTTGHHDRAAVMSSGKENLTINISDHEIEFTYKDPKNQGSCEIVSRYLQEGNTLTLEHRSMDFLMVDIEDFPPRSYTYSQNNSKLVLTSGEIRGLGNKKISYHLTRAA